MKRYRVRALQTVHTVKGDDHEQGGRLPSMAVPGTPSAVFIVTEERLHRLRRVGAVVLLGVVGDDDAPAPVMVPQDDEPDRQALPLDFPSRSALVSAGLNTIDAVASFPDLTSLRGIGPASERAILKTLMEEFGV